ncbi:MAG: hypothetical protein COW02_10905 [Comamonadaceae bacterium CG12_big_fil_rev_8_21_14_0_65_59_15]|nr:MAG: hypothetical protein COW02_10905 [Comamonadaceae bacterium CG12_big_fil_rev_8_21_14_0_65_59_15]
MTNPDGKTAFSLHIETGTENGDAVPAAVLAQILTSAQRSFELIGVHVEGRTIQQRARISAATRSRFQLVCRLPVPGCYAVPIELGGTDLLAEHITAAMDVFKKIIGGITSHDSEAINKAMPDAGLRHRLLEAIRGMAPRADAKWSLKLWDAGNIEFGELNTESEATIRAAIVPADERAESQVVTGYLININFIKRIVTIIYPPTKREMECVYDEAIEDLLIDNRRDLIQVTGLMVLDDAGAPKQITNVNDIRELDLSPLVVDTVKVGKLVLKAKQSITLAPSTDETKQLICVTHADLGIDAFARTRDALVSELNEQIGMLWQEYALAADDDLDGMAIKMKQALLAAFSEVTHGA